MNDLRPTRTTALSRSRERLRRATGAVDLASIMVGVLVIGIIGGVIAATVFLVIPWSQDQAAQHSLSAVVDAESVYKAKDDSHVFADYTTVKDVQHLLPGTTKLNARASASGDCFAAASKSDTGRVFWITCDDTTPVELKSSDTSPITDLEALAASLN